MQVDNRERGFAYAYDAPLDMRMDPDQELTAHEIVNTWDRRRLARALREYGEERFADRIAGEIVRRRGRAGADDDLRAQRGDHRRDPRARPLRRRPPGQAHVPGDPHRGQRRAQPARRGAPAQLGRARRSAAASPRSPSTRSRTAASSASSPRRRAAASARPTCPSACAATRPRRSSCTVARSSPTPGEIAANPRSKSARLRAARKLSGGALHGPSTQPHAPAPHRSTRAGSPARRAGWRPRGRPVPRGRTGAFERISRIPDYRVVDRVLRSRGCIWLIGLLLGGIVAMQVSLLRLNAGISRAVQTQSRSRSRTWRCRPRSPS